MSITIAAFRIGVLSSKKLANKLNVGFGSSDITAGRRRTKSGIKKAYVTKGSVSTIRYIFRPTSFSVAFNIAPKLS